MLHHVAWQDYCFSELNWAFCNRTKFLLVSPSQQATGQCHWCKCCILSFGTPLVYASQRGTRATQSFGPFWKGNDRDLDLIWFHLGHADAQPKTRRITWFLKHLMVLNHSEWCNTVCHILYIHVHVHYQYFKIIDVWAQDITTLTLRWRCATDKYLAPWVTFHGWKWSDRR